MAYFVMLQMGFLLLGPEDPILRRLSPATVERPPFAGGNAGECHDNGDATGSEQGGMLGGQWQTVAATRLCPGFLMFLVIWRAARGEHVIGSPAFHVVLGTLCWLSTLPSSFKGNSFKRKALPPMSGSGVEKAGDLRSSLEGRREDYPGRRPAPEEEREFGPSGGDMSHHSSPRSWEEVSPRKYGLGSTSGLVAAGAWAARLEVANLLESGCPPEHLLALIRRGEESHFPLRLDWESKEDGSRFDGDDDKGSDSASRAAGRRPKERSRTPLRRLHHRPSAEEAQVAMDLFEGESVEDVIAEQNAILTELAKNKDDPPWMAPSSGAKTPLAGTAPSLAKGRSALHLAPNVPTFGKRANPPPKGAAVSSPAPTGMTDLGASADGEDLPAFKRKAQPPPAGVIPEPSTPPVRAPPSRPSDGPDVNSLGAREKESLDRFAREAVEIYEGLEVVGITMDLERYVRSQKGIDREKFLLHTAPNRASTGLRYVRVMKGIVEWIETFDPLPKDEKATPLERLRLVEYVELLIQKGVGFNTPQTLLFALDFFSKAFGFDPTGIEWNRAKRLAVKYKKSKPGLANRAPLFGKTTLAALEQIVLDDLAILPHRIAAGKLRLCCQASIRYDDLVHTPLSNLEWVRRRGGTKVVGVRAKTTQGKNKARPWVASLMATCPSRDRWLTELMSLVMQVHGSCWASDDHFGKDTTRDGLGFTQRPARLESDVCVVKDALKAFGRSGGDPGLSGQELELLRWHGGKATLTSLMQHLELDPKMIRLAGDWAAREDTMPDTYLREAQLLVLRGQESCLTYLRAGGDFGGLVSGGQVGLGPPGDGGNSAPADSHGGDAEADPKDKESRAAADRLKVQARLAGMQGDYQGVAGDSLCAPFLDAGFDKDGRPLESVAESEACSDAVPQEKLLEMLEPNRPDDDVYVVYCFDNQAQNVKSEPVETGPEKAAGVAELDFSTPTQAAATLEDDDDDLEGHTMRFVMLDRPSSANRLHLPTVGGGRDEDTLIVPVPKCGAKGSFSFLGASEAMDQSTELCLRCFGRRPEGSCNRLCGVKLRVGDDVYRCTRRCSTECSASGVHLCHVHGF
eukprot:s2629_g4.t1